MFSVLETFVHIGHVRLLLFLLDILDIHNEQRLCPQHRTRGNANVPIHTGHSMTLLSIFLQYQYNDKSNEVVIIFGDLYAN